jgi:zinc D-Ala-D-Ala carboxypeptidase
MDLNLKLSQHFTLGEMIKTSNRIIQNIPTQEDINRMTFFCNNFLEALRGQFGPIWINSGFRCKDLNDSIRRC